MDADHVPSEITEILMVIVIFGAMPMVSWRSEHVVFIGSAGRAHEELPHYR